MKTIALLALLLASASAAQSPPPVPTRTIVNDAAALARLRRNTGMTLQWIGWERRGHVDASERDGFIHLIGIQHQPGGRGALEIDGDVVSIDARSFAFRGHIAIIDVPDPGRECIRDGIFEFRVTGTRRYWRLQQMEACDGLTDYVDIYF